MNYVNPRTGILALLAVLVAAAGVFTFPLFDHRMFDDSAETKAALKWMGTLNPHDQLSTTLGSRDERPLVREAWRPVIEAKEPSTESMLASSSWIRLDDQEARIFTEYMRPVDKKAPYLLRGLTSNGAGSTRVYLLPRSQISVSGGALSHHPVRLRKQCFVAWLDSAPTAVWVSYSVAE